MAVEDETYNLLTNQSSNKINWRPAPQQVETVIDIDLAQLGDGEIDLTPANSQFQTPKRNGTLLFIQNEQNRRRKR